MTAPAPVKASSTCPVCENPATWQVGGEVACTRCLGPLVAALHAAEPHPFRPHLPEPLYRGKF